MLTDLDVDHGVDHVNHMGTEAWRCATVTRIEHELDGDTVMYTPSAGDIGEEERRRHIEIEPVENPVGVPTPEPEKVGASW
jgi:hypothetical protein